jgi:hypothetical protein
MGFPADAGAETSKQQGEGQVSRIESGSASGNDLAQSRSMDRRVMRPIRIVRR